MSKSTHTHTQGAVCEGERNNVRRNEEWRGWMIETEETAEKINEGFQDWSKEACSIFCLNTRHIQQLSISLSHSSSSSYSSFFFHFVLLTRAGHYIDIYLNHYIPWYGNCLLLLLKGSITVKRCNITILLVLILPYTHLVIISSYGWLFTINVIVLIFYKVPFFIATVVLQNRYRVQYCQKYCDIWRIISLVNDLGWDPAFFQLSVLMIFLSDLWQMYLWSHSVFQPSALSIFGEMSKVITA